MDRPTRNKKTVNYTDFQDDDDEDFACVKPPPKKARTAIKDQDSESHRKTASASPNDVVDLTGSGHKKRASLEDTFCDRDLETALSLSLLDSLRTQDGDAATKTDEYDSSQPPQCSPPVLIHCSSEGSHLVCDGQPRPNSPPVLSNCSIDGSSLGLNLISVDASPTSISKQKDTSEEQRKPPKEKKDNQDDEDYQPQNTPDSESDADFTEEDESEDETFTTKKKVVKQKTEKKKPPAAKNKAEKKDKKPTKSSKAKGSAPNSVLCRSPAAPVCGAKKTPTSPLLSKPAVCSSPSGARLPKWNPPGLLGRSPGASQNAHVKSPGQGLRLGLSRMARVKPLHPNAAI